MLAFFLSSLCVWVVLKIYWGESLIRALLIEFEFGLG